MPTIKYTYSTPVADPNSLAGLKVDNYITFSLGDGSVSGTFVPLIVDPQNPEGPALELPGMRQNYSIPLTVDDLDTIMDTVFNRANALGLIPIPGTCVVEE